MHDSARTANLLGATALAITDRLLSRVTTAAGVSPSGAASLVVLSTAPGLSVTELGRRIGLSQPAAARMLDSLETRGLTCRDRGAGRSVSVHLTETGTRTARSLLAARGAPLEDAVGCLDETEHAVLEQILDKLLTRLYDHVGDSDHLCRLCDRATCTNRATCPVGVAERQRAR